jgi:hypothetical protein
MKYQIDQSGKIEQTNRVTVLAYTNRSDYAVLMPARVKRQLQEAFRQCGMTRVFIYYVFAAGVYFLVKDIKRQSDITIDIEYPGKDKLKSEILASLLKACKRPAHHIRFSRIGNQPKVHYAAHDVFTSKLEPDKLLTLAEIVEALKKTDGRLRECFATLVDARPRSLNKRYHKSIRKSINK